MDCYGLKDKVKLYESSTFKDRRNGLAFYIRFDHVDDPGQYEIVDTEDKLL